MNTVTTLSKELRIKEKKILKIEKKNRILKLEIERLKRIKNLLIWLLLMGCFCMYVGGREL